MKQPRYITAWCTDIGIQKETNQDSALLMQAETVVGSVLLAVLCDGMGGLAKGEVASAAVIRAFREWFRQELPGMLGETDFPQILSQSWNRVIHHMNVQIADYGSSAHIGLGTTVTAMLIVEDQYYIAIIRAVILSISCRCLFCSIRYRSPLSISSCDIVPCSVS